MTYILKNNKWSQDKQTLACWRSPSRADRVSCFIPSNNNLWRYETEPVMEKLILTLSVITVYNVSAGAVGGAKLCSEAPQRQASITTHNIGAWNRAGGTRIRLVQHWNVQYKFSLHTNQAWCHYGWAIKSDIKINKLKLGVDLQISWFHSTHKKISFRYST